LRLLLTFSTVRFSLLKQAWKEFARSESLHPVRHRPEDELFAGGLVVVLDWERKKILTSRPLPRASGVARVGERLYVCAYDKIVVLDADLVPVGSIQRRDFNNLHGIGAHEEGFVVCSTGIDTLLFLDRRFLLRARWCAYRSGFATTAHGHTRSLDFRRDHRGTFYPTQLHTVHPNCVLWDSTAREVLVSFFQQGEIHPFQVDARHGAPIVTGLKSPHGIARFGSGYVLADSAANQLVAWSRTGARRVIPVEGADWLQDVKVAPGGNLLACDANNCRVLELSPGGRLLDEWRYDCEWKVHEALVLDGAEESVATPRDGPGP
jgi:hypothetical protein